MENLRPQVGDWVRILPGRHITHSMQKYVGTEWEIEEFQRTRNHKTDIITEIRFKNGGKSWTPDSSSKDNNINYWSWSEEAVKVIRRSPKKKLKLILKGKLI